MKKFAMFIFAALMTLLSVTAGAQSTLRIRGTIAGLDGNVLSVTSRDGKALKIHLADNFTVSAAKAVALADIKPGDFVGPASRMGADGKLVAISLQLFSAALRGVVPEGPGTWNRVR